MSQLSIEYLNTQATVIQKTWYNYQDRQIFNLMLTAIRVLEQVEPRLIIRRLAPKEWILLNDKAFNVKVMFRLEGQVFPPTVVYRFIIQNPSNFNINSKIRGGHNITGVVSRARSNEWRELTIEPLENFLPQQRSYQPSRTMHYNSPVAVARKPVIIPSTPSTFHMKKLNGNSSIGSRSRPGTSSTIPAYFSLKLNKYFDDDQELGGGDMGNFENVRQNSPYLERTGDAQVSAKKFTPIDDKDEELELEDWAHNLNDNLDDELVF